MRIKLLFIPRFIANFASGEQIFGELHFPPIGISVLTGFLKKRHINVSQDDLLIKSYRQNMDLRMFTDKNNVESLIKNNNDENLEEIGEKILKMTNINGYDVIGFSLYEADNPSIATISIVLAKLIKEKYGSTIIIGGHIPSHIKEYLLKTGCIDYGITQDFESPAEQNLLKFCESFEKGINEKEIPGLEYIKEGHLVTNNFGRDATNIMPSPSFDDLPLELYRYTLTTDVNGNNYKSNILVLPYFFIKGCAFHCAFCGHSLKRCYITKDNETIIEEIKYLSKKYNTNYFIFLNSSINITHKFANDLAVEFIKNDLNIKWSDCGNFTNLDKNLLDKLKTAGMKRIIFGLESASPKVLRYINKTLDLEQVRDILKYCNEIGIWPEVDMICGFPYERDSDTNITMEFIKNNSNYIKSIYLHKFFLDGRIREFQYLYGIKIKNEIPDKLSTSNREQPFDEINGLKWDERIELTKETYNRLIKFLRNLKIRHGTQVQEIFFLSSLPEWKNIMEEGWDINNINFSCCIKIN